MLPTLPTGQPTGSSYLAQFCASVTAPTIYAYGSDTVEPGCRHTIAARLGSHGVDQLRLALILATLPRATSSDRF